MSDWQDALWKLLPVLTSFGVLIVGFWLTHSAKRREWIADNQKEEYRKLLAALNRLNMALTARHVKGTQSLQEIEQAMEEISVASNTSLFICEYLKTTKVLGDVYNTSEQFVNGGSFEEYRTKYWQAVNSILDSATKISI